MPKQTPKTSIKIRPKAVAKPTVTPRVAPKRAVKRTPRPNRPSRPAKKRRLLWLDITVGVATVTLVAFGFWYNLRDNTDQTCAAMQEHEVRVASDTFTPSEITVTRCDVVKIINTGREDYDLMFGQRDEHVSYPGFQMTLIRPNEFFAVDMVQAGTYEMHDHIRDKAHLKLEVKD